MGGCYVEISIFNCDKMYLNKLCREINIKAYDKIIRMKRCICVDTIFNCFIETVISFYFHFSTRQVNFILTAIY